MTIKRFVLICLLLFMGSVSAQNYTVTMDLSYAKIAISDQQYLDVYVPKSKKAMPCVVWIHGGAWMYGSKTGLPQEVGFLLNEHYVVASIGYRLSGEAIFPAQIYDCKAAIRFLKAHASKYKIDTSRMVVAGASAGGHLAALVGTSAGVSELEDNEMGSPTVSSRVQAVIDFYGPTDFLIMDEFPENCVNPQKHLVPNSPESRLLGCNIVDCPDKVKQANPITYITTDDPPFLIFHGKADCTVTPIASELLTRQLTEAGVPVYLNLIPGAGHGGREFLSNGVKNKIKNFLKSVFDSL